MNSIEMSPRLISLIYITLTEISLPEQWLIFNSIELLVLL